MLSLCEIHNKSENINVSSALKKILTEGSCSKEEVIVHLVVFKIEDGKKNRGYSYFISGSEADELKIKKHGVVELFDRDHVRKEINDRLLVVEIKRNLAPICDDCFGKLSSIMNFKVDY